MNLVDELTETRGNGNRECVAQGAGNILSGLFGGTGGCGMIGQTVININAGGRGRLSGIMMALTLLTFILFTDKLIEQVPIAALVGVMFMMVIETFAWSSFRILKKIPKSDAFCIDHRFCSNRSFRFGNCRICRRYYFCFGYLHGKMQRRLELENVLKKMGPRCMKSGVLCSLEV